jgi:hypothetical protein
MPSEASWNSKASGMGVGGAVGEAVLMNDKKSDGTTKETNSDIVKRDE